MPNFRLPVAPLNGGVSTQPFDSRLPNQTKTSDNTILRLQRGLEKRPGSKHVGELTLGGTLSNNMFVHFFTYGDERYVLMIDGAQSSPNKVQVFDLDNPAAACTVTLTGGEAYLTTVAAARDSIKAITYGTTTLIVNTETATGVTGSLPGHNIVGNCTQLPTPATGGTADNVLNAAGTATTYIAGNEVALLSSDIGAPAGIYECDTISSVSGPWWSRVEAESTNNQLDSTKMPISLTRTGVRAFTLDVIEWNRRLSGDTNLNPAPSFAKNAEKINDICIFQDRLWIAHETGVISSQAGDLFNFWVDDYTNVVDSDPIELVMPGPAASQVNWLVPLDQRIICFGSSDTQYEITTREFFTPSSTNLQPTTNYANSSRVRPQLVGQQIAFAQDKFGTSALWEYFYDFGSDSNIAIEASVQCQGYLPDNPYFLTTSQNNSLMFMAGVDSNEITVYHYYWDVNQKLQSAFAKWKFYDYASADADILGLWATDTRLFLVIKRLGKIWLERVDISHPSLTSGLSFPICLDNQYSSQGVYSSVDDTTTWTITDWVDDELVTANEDAYRIVLPSGWILNDNDKRGATLLPTVTENGSATLLTVSGRWDSLDSGVTPLPVNVGILYTQSASLSQPMARDDQGQTIQGNFQVRTMEVRHEETTAYDVTVTPNNRDAKTFGFYAGRIGSAVLGEFAQAEYGRFNVRVFGNSQDTDIVITSRNPYPCLITKLEYIGDFVPQRTNPVK